MVMGMKEKVVKKVMSFLVILSFIYSNTCFAMPVVSQSVIADVKDTMALPSGLQQDKPIGLADRANISESVAREIATHMGALAKSKYSSNEELKKVIDMWINNAGADISNADITQNVMDNSYVIVKGDEKFVVMENAQKEGVFGFKLTADNKVLELSKEQISKELGKADRSGVAKFSANTSAESDAGYARMTQALIDSAPESSAEDKANIASLIDEIAQKTAAANLTPEERKAEEEYINNLRDMNSKGLIRFGDAQVEGSKEVAGQVDRFAMAVQGKDKAGNKVIVLAKEFKKGGALEQHAAQILDHENHPEGSYTEHKNNIAPDSMQAKKYGADVEKAGSDMRNVITAKAEKAAQETAKKSTVTIEKDLLAVNENSPKDVQEKAEQRSVGIAKEAGVSDELIAKAGPKGALSIVKTLIAQALSYLRDGYSAALQSMTDNLAQTTDSSNKTAAAAALLSEGKYVAYSAKSAVSVVNGNIVPSSVIAPLIPVAMGQNVKDGAIKIYDLTNEQMQGFEKALNELEAKFPGISKKFSLSAGKEDSLGIKGEELSVVYVSGETIKNMAGAYYLPISSDALNQNRLNGLNVFILAASRGLSERAKAIADNLTEDGIRSVEQITVADETQYEQLKADYDKFVNLFIQA